MRRSLAVLSFTAALATAVVVSTAARPAAADHDLQAPPLGTPTATLDAALHCPATFDDPREPVLLVHGTFTHDQENYAWNYLAELTQRGFDVCTVTLPNRSLDDIQVATEYVVHAVREMSAASGDEVDILGHSQGGLEPRWAIKWWDDMAARIDDLVMLATPNHGTIAAPLGQLLCASCHQMRPDSEFLAALNAGDETPDGVDYTSIYSVAVDEIVIPNDSAELDGAANISVQDACFPIPRVADHVSLVADTVAFDLALDAFTQAGPADVDRADPRCVFPPLFVDGDSVTGGIQLLLDTLADPHIPDVSVTPTEPGLAAYTGDLCAAPPDHGLDDVPAWVDHEVAWLLAAGHATGYPDGTFRPQLDISRAQVARMLYRLAGRPPVGDLAAHGMPDAPAWVDDAVTWLVANDYATGYPDGTFKPNRPITRAQVARMLYRIAGSADVTGLDHGFGDVPRWVDEAVTWLVTNDYATGYPDGTFKPNRAITRAQLTRMAHRIHCTH